jgi:3-hydroxyisobutyrate dehydrogenase-like beta-hydroxyacid dehydrogenase
MTNSPTNVLNRIALIGFGEVGQMLARDLAYANMERISAYDLAFADGGSPQRAAAEALDVTVAGSAAEAVANAQLVISAVTASSALDAARSVAADVPAGTFFLDLNSVAPGTKRDAAEAIGAGRGRYVEAAVMAPVYPKRLETPIFLGGPYANDLIEVLQALGFNVSVYSDRIGLASAAKMCRSVMIKGLEALSMECLLTARRAGVERDVLASLNRSFPGFDWAEMTKYNLERMTTHGVRRSDEMTEVAKTVRELGIAPLMSAAASIHQKSMGQLKLKERCGGALPEDLSSTLDAIMEADPWNRAAPKSSS